MFLRPASSQGVIGIPSAMKPFHAASKAIGFAAFAGPGMSRPARPESAGSEAPKRATAWSQEFVDPREVVLIEPVGSATAS